ncbi:MAG: hypothetical protein ACTSVD_04760 [Candidatus Thorarchaeota archaeon]
MLDEKNTMLQSSSGWRVIYVLCLLGWHADRKSGTSVSCQRDTYGRQEAILEVRFEEIETPMAPQQVSTCRYQLA